MDWDDDGLYKEWARLINNEWDNMCRMLDEALQAGTVGNIYNGKKGNVPRQSGNRRK